VRTARGERTNGWTERDAAREAKSSPGECLLFGCNANQATSRHYAHIFDAPPISCQQTRHYNNINNNTRQINALASITKETRTDTPGLFS